MNLFTIQSGPDIINIRREDRSNLIEADNKIRLVKIIRDNTCSGLLDAKNFVDLMLSELNRIQQNPITLKNKLTSELEDIEDINSLNEILSFVRAQRIRR
jgi:hypothetical protein